MGARLTAVPERIRSLDVLRGVAVLGILIMNIQSFSMPETAYSNPSSFGTLAGADGVVWLVSHLLADGKFLSIFAMLFGAGVLLFSNRIEARGGSPAPLHVRRMLWLLAFGLLHAYLLWYGDILAAYALCGLLVFLTRRWRPRLRLLAGLALLCVAPLLAIVEARSMASWPAQERSDLITEMWSPPPERIAEEVEAYRGGWRDQMDERVPMTWSLHTEEFPRAELWRVAGLMLMGMSFFQWGVLDASRSSGFYLAMATLGAAIALPLTWYGARLNLTDGWSTGYSMLYGWQINYWASILMALAWIGLVMWIVRRWGRSAWIHPIESAGRMAFTNYLLQTAMCTAIFYGHGLGLFGSVSRAGQAAVVIAVWAILLVFSELWMRSFRFGPLEWAWRSLTYGRILAIRKPHPHAAEPLATPQTS